MEVYIEDAILQNLLINFMLLKLTAFCIRDKISFIKIFLSATVGTIFAVILVFFNLNFYFSLVLKALCGLIMILIVTKKISIKKFLFSYFIFLTSTFIMGGLILSLQNSFSGFDINYALLVIFVFYVILKNLVNEFYRKRTVTNFIYDLTLQNENKKIDIRVYLDSGNLLQDDKSGLPILIVNFNTFEKIFIDKVNIFDYLTQKLDKKIKGHYIVYRTLSGTDKMFVCKIDKISIKNTFKKEINVLLGLGKNTFKNKDYEGLLSPLAL